SRLARLSAQASPARTKVTISIIFSSQKGDNPSPDFIAISIRGLQRQINIAGGGERNMGDSLKRKRRLWVLAWCACCAGAASAMTWAAQRAAPVCRQSDLETTTFVSAQALAEEDGEKRVFLTFDDGPSATTETVLDVLKEKGVPATFFVVSADNN